MKRSEDVFFFTLIDFLVQCLFFGLLLYVVVQAGQRQSEAARKDEAAKTPVQKVEEWTGFSRIAELSDFLTTLVPPNDFKGWAEFISSVKDPEKAKAALAFVEAAGGVEAAKRAVFAGYGHPPCKWVKVGDRTRSVPIGVMTLRDRSIEYELTDDEFWDLVRRNDIVSERVGELSFSAFKATFGVLKTLQPDCRYFAHYAVRSELLAPIDTVNHVFRQADRR
jgi:hypothetical protein